MATVLDIRTINRLREELGDDSREIILDILVSFEEEGYRLLGALKDALRDGDADGISRVAHSLKGSSASLGAVELAQLCAEVEQMGKAGVIAGDVDIHQMMADAFERANNAFKALEL